MGFSFFLFSHKYLFTVPVIASSSTMFEVTRSLPASWMCDATTLTRDLRHICVTAKIFLLKPYQQAKSVLHNYV